MHVLVVPSWYPTTETPLAGIYFVEQAQCLKRHGMQIGVVYPEQQSLRNVSWSALRTKHFQTAWTNDHGLPTLRQYGWNVWWKCPPGLRCRVRSAVRLARKYVDRYGAPDLIHAQSGRWAGAAAARIGKTLSVPYVLTEHFSGFRGASILPWRWPLVEEGYRHAGGITAVSTSLKHTLAAHDLAPLSDISVYPNLAPTSFFSLPPNERPTPPPFRFVTIARLTPQKDVKGLLCAFAQVASNTSDVTLTIVGDGPNRQELETRSRELGIADQVSFRGRLDRKSVRTALWKAHAFVLASRHETFGVVLLEAMATGLPVVSTASGGPQDIVTDDTGVLVPVDAPDALADALQKIQEREPLFDAENIRSYVLDRYGPAPFIRRTRSLYRRGLTQTP